MFFPPLFSELHKLDFDYADGEGIDFEPYESFLPEDEVQDWFKAWTGNNDADGSQFLVFGQDGTGGFAAIWLAKEACSLLEQPIVFMGSEGEVGVVARNFEDYLWLLASGHGPYEAVTCPDDTKAPSRTFTDFAKAQTNSRRRLPSEILADAEAAFPTFRSWIETQCR